MKIIGLCGGSGSGKGTVCACFSNIDVPSIDTDAVYRELTLKDSPCVHALVDSFGDDILFADGSLDRKKLASIVFSGEGSDNRREILNRITHKFILDETRRRLSDYESKGFTMAIIDAPVLFESGFNKECHSTVCVVADKTIRVKRIMKRDGISEIEALMRINSQKSDEELRSLCDFVIENNSDYDSLFAQVVRVKELLSSN